MSPDQDLLVRALMALRGAQSLQERSMVALCGQGPDGFPDPQAGKKAWEALASIRDVIADLEAAIVEDETRALPPVAVSGASLT